MSCVDQVHTNSTASRCRSEQLSDMLVCTSVLLVYACRSDDLEGLELEHAPKLKMLGLRACYSLRHVRVMEDASGTDPVPLTVSYF